MWLIQRGGRTNGPTPNVSVLHLLGNQKLKRSLWITRVKLMRQDGCWWKASTATANWNLQLNCNLDILDQHSEAESCEPKGPPPPNAKMPPLRGNWAILKGDEAHHCVLRKSVDKTVRKSSWYFWLRIIGYYCALVAVAIILPFSVFSATGMQSWMCWIYPLRMQLVGNEGFLLGFPEP